MNHYRVWHPLDHVSARHVRLAPDGSIGPGAQIALCEVLARIPRFTIHAVSTIEKLDEEGFVHKVVVRGVTLARMEHTFNEVEGAMTDENCLMVPGSHRLALLSRVLLPWRFPEPKGQAWLKHSVEEMGTLRTSFWNSTRETNVERGQATGDASVPAETAVRLASHPSR